MGAASRRRRQMTTGYTHIARINGKHIRGGRPLYKRHHLGTVADAIARERAAAAKLAKINQKSKK